MVVFAREDLANRLGIPVEQIELITMEFVTWPDGSLGCPEPGVEYIQVQREGTLIRLRADKHIYQYHSGGGRPPFLCEHPSVVYGVTHHLQVWVMSDRARVNKRIKSYRSYNSAKRKKDEPGDLVRPFICDCIWISTHSLPCQSRPLIFTFASKLGLLSSRL